MELTAKRMLLWVLSMLFTMTAGAISGEGNEECPYKIWNSEDWREYCQDEEGQYLSAYVALMDDIEVSFPCSKNLKGTFDGNGHTIKYSCTDDRGFGGLFTCLKGGTIQNLHVTGTIYGCDVLGSIVAIFNGGTIQNCSSDARLVFNHSFDISKLTNEEFGWGGIVGYMSVGESTLSNCVFSGSTDYDSENKSDGAWFSGMVGYVDYGSLCTIDHCMTLTPRASLVEGPSYFILERHYDDSASDKFGDDEHPLDVISTKNCYYLESFAPTYTVTRSTPVSSEILASGSLAYNLGRWEDVRDGNSSRSVGDYWRQDLSKANTVPLISCQDNYKVNKAKFVLNGHEVYAGYANATYILPEPTFMSSIATGMTADYTIADTPCKPGEKVGMTDSIYVNLTNVRGPMFTEDGTLVIEDEDDWCLFCKLVDDYDMTALNARMEGNVDLDMAEKIVRSEKGYRGTFDGQGHTLSYTAMPYDIPNFRAPFEVIRPGAKFKRVRLFHQFNSKFNECGGLAWRAVADADADVASQPAIEISECISDVLMNLTGNTTITDATYQGGAGGMIGKLEGGVQVKFTSCGSISEFNIRSTQANRDLLYAGGYVGVSDAKSWFSCYNSYSYIASHGFPQYHAAAFGPNDKSEEYKNFCAWSQACDYLAIHVAKNLGDSIDVRAGELCDLLKNQEPSVSWGQIIPEIRDGVPANSSYPLPFAPESWRVYKINFNNVAGVAQTYIRYFTYTYGYGYANAGQTVTFGNQYAAAGTAFRPFYRDETVTPTLYDNFEVRNQSTGELEECRYDPSLKQASFTMPAATVTVTNPGIAAPADNLVKDGENIFQIDLDQGKAVMNQAGVDPGTQHVVLPETVNYGMYNLPIDVYACTRAFYVLAGQPITYVDMSKVKPVADHTPEEHYFEVIPSGLYPANTPFEGLSNSTLLFLPKQNIATMKTNVLHYDEENETYKTARYALKDDADLKVEVPIDFVAEEVSYDRVFRNFTDGYATVMLPFGVPTGTEEVNGQVVGGDFYTCTGITANCHCAVMGKVTDDFTQPNTPYIYKMAADNTTLRMSVIPVQVKATTGIAAPQTAALSQDQVTLIGTYERLDFTDENNAGCYGYARYAQGSYDAGAFVPFAAGAYVPACRAYLYVPDAAVPAASKPNQLLLSFDDQPTGITSLPASTSAATGKLYNLAGQRVAAGYHGIVIRDGKKVKQ